VLYFGGESEMFINPKKNILTGDLLMGTNLWYPGLMAIAGFLIGFFVVFQSGNIITVFTLNDGWIVLSAIFASAFAIIGWLWGSK
jgi:hypothetical protein